jgi:hypothetical protein
LGQKSILLSESSKFGRNLGQNSNLLKLNAEKQVMKSSPLPLAQNQTEIPSNLFFLYQWKWSGVPENQTNKIEGSKSYRNEQKVIPIF